MSLLPQDPDPPVTEGERLRRAIEDGKRLTALRREDVRNVVAKIPESVARLLMTEGDRLRIAGGWVRAIIAREPPHDIDLFASSAEVADRAVKALAPEGVKVMVTQFARSFICDRRIVQVIDWAYSPSAGDTILAFDFTIAAAAVWYTPGRSEWTGLCARTYYEDLAAKRLRLQLDRGLRTEVEEGGTLLRMLKYGLRGYAADTATIARVAWRTCVRAEDAAEVERVLREIDPEYEPDWLAPPDPPF